MIRNESRPPQRFAATPVDGGVSRASGLPELSTAPDPHAAWPSMRLDELYPSRHAAARAGLARFFLDAEEAYFRHLPPDECGTLSLEPLVGGHPGPPVYLRDRLNPAQRADFASELKRLEGDFDPLRPDLHPHSRVARLARCLQQAPSDLK